MSKIKRLEIDGNEYTMEEVLYNRYYAEKIKKAIVNSQENLIKLFQFLNQEELEREKAPKKDGVYLKYVVYEFLEEYEEEIKSSISIDRLIDAANKANYIDLLRYLICNLIGYIEADKQTEYIDKIIKVIKEKATLKQIKTIAYYGQNTLTQEEMDLLFDRIAELGDIYFLAVTITGILSDTFNMKKLVQAFEEKIDKMIAEEDIKGILKFTEGNLKIISNCTNVDFTNSINKIISFILLKGNVKNIYSLTRHSYKTPYFRKMINALIKTGCWDYWYSITHMFSDDRRSMEENKEVMSDLVCAALKTNVPAYIYLFVSKTKSYLSEDDIRLILVKMLELNDKTYIAYLIMELKSIKLSQNTQVFIQHNYPNISTNDVLNYNDSIATELAAAFLWNLTLEYAKYRDYVSEDFSFDEIGIAVHEDGSFDNAKQLKLSNIDIGIY